MESPRGKPFLYYDGEILKCGLIDKNGAFIEMAPKYWTGLDRFKKDSRDIIGMMSDEQREKHALKLYGAELIKLDVYYPIRTSPGILSQEDTKYNLHVLKSGEEVKDERKTLEEGMAILRGIHPNIRTRAKLSECRSGHETEYNRMYRRLKYLNSKQDKSTDIFTVPQSSGTQTLKRFTLEQLTFFKQMSSQLMEYNKLIPIGSSNKMNIPSEWYFWYCEAYKVYTQEQNTLSEVELVVMRDLFSTKSSVNHHSESLISKDMEREIKEVLEQHRIKSKEGSIQASHDERLMCNDTYLELLYEWSRRHNPDPNMIETNLISEQDMEKITNSVDTVLSAGKSKDSREIVTFMRGVFMIYYDDPRKSYYDNEILTKIIETFMTAGLEM